MAVPEIAHVARAFPPHYSKQSELTDALLSLWKDKPHNIERLQAMHDNVAVTGRYHALPLGDYVGLDSFTKRNRAYLEIATPLAARVAASALAGAGLSASDVDALFFVTVTGIAVPAVDARICNLLPFRRDLKRTPIFGLGCVAGAAGLSRASDYIRAYPSHVALLVSVELCSLTLQHDDHSVANVIASGLFGDGAAAAVLTGEGRSHAQKPKVLATRSVFYPHSEDLLGWEIGGDGFRVILSGQVPQVVGDSLAAEVDAMLSACGHARADVTHWICHAGGPKVMQTVQQRLALSDADVRTSLSSYRQVGNLSSASVLLVLEDVMQQNLSPGSLAVLMAFGPGFCSELMVLQWA